MFVSAIKEHFKVRFGEWIVALALFGWGLVVITTPQLFQNSSIYVNMGRLAPQDLWGWSATIIGAIRLTFLTINGTWRRSAHLRAIGAGLSACVWAAIIGSYLTLDHRIPNIFTVGALLALDIYSLWFATADAKVSDVHSRGRHDNPKN